MRSMCAVDVTEKHVFADATDLMRAGAQGQSRRHDHRRGWQAVRPPGPGGIIRVRFRWAGDLAASKPAARCPTANSVMMGTCCT